MKELKLESMCDTEPATFSIDEEGDLILRFANWKAHYIPAKEIPKLTRWLVEGQVDSLSKFSPERRAWQEAVHMCDLF